MEAKYTIEHHYQMYLQLVGLDEKTMCEEQRLQLRDTFYAAVGDIIVFLNEDILEMDEQMAYEVIDGFQSQVRAYFTHRVMRGGTHFTR